MKNSYRIAFTGSLLNEDELKHLKGGDYPSGCEFYCWVHIPPDISYSGVGCGASAFEAEANCNDQWGYLGAHCHCV